MFTVLLFTVVVVPLTIKLPAIVTSSGKPNLILLFETKVVTSFAVPSKTNSSVPTLTTSLLGVLSASFIVKSVLIATVPAAVNLPCLSTVKVGIAVADP